MKWITREHIKVDRVACPWLIRRFIDPDAQFLFVDEGQLLKSAAREDAIPFDAPHLPEVKLNHRGPHCSFEAIIEDYHLHAPGLARLALIVRAADIIRRAMVRMDGALAKKKLNAQMLLQVHDELVFEVPEPELQERQEALAPGEDLGVLAVLGRRRQRTARSYRMRWPCRRRGGCRARWRGARRSWPRRSAPARRSIRSARRRCLYTARGSCRASRSS